MQRTYCVSEGDFVAGRLTSGSSLSGLFRCFMRNPSERWDTICNLISCSLVTFLPPNLQYIVPLSSLACKEIMTRVDDFYRAYRQFKEWHERYLSSLFGDWIDLDGIKLDTVIGMKRLPPFLRERYRCPIRTGLVDRFYYRVSGELEKNWDLAAAITTNGFLLLEMLHKIDQELQDMNVIVGLILSSIKRFAELVRYYIGYDRYEIRIEDRCCEYDKGDRTDNDLSESLGRAIILGGFVPSEYAADIHYNLDFQFGLPKGQKEELIDEARRRGIEADISRIRTGTETVDREELEVIREILSNDKAYNEEGEALIRLEWVIIDKKTGEELVKVKKDGEDVTEGGFIFAFTGKGGVKGGRRGRIEGIALMGAGASGAVVAPYIVLMGSHREYWLKDDIRRKLEEYNENGYQVVFKINYDPSVECRPYGPEHIKSVEIKGIKPLS